jgi:hypothetical protein
VPNVENRSVGAAFAALRHAGFAVSTGSAVDAQAAFGSVAVGEESPPPDAFVARRIPVTLTPETIPHPIASFVVPRPMPHYVVPNFVGERLDVAARWFRGRHVDWDADLRPLAASTAPSIFAAYTIVAQSPAPGKIVQLGVLHHSGFHPTPVFFTVRAR